MRPPRPRFLLAFLLQAVVASLCGCGWGGTPTLIGPTPDFTLAVSPDSAAMLPGGPPTAFTARIVPINGFSAAVAVSVAATSAITCTEPACAITLPAGTTSSALHIAAPAGMTPGTYTLTFTAVSGTLTHTATATVTVNAPPTPDFSFSVSPTASSAVAGTAAPAYSFTIVPSNGFASPVTITVAAPNGIVCVQTPCALTTSLNQINNALQFTPSASLTPGAYTITFTAVSGTLTHTATATLTVTAPPPVPDFSFAVSPVASSAPAGAAAPAYSFTITPSNGFASPVTVTVTVPAGLTCAQTPCSLTTSATQVNDALHFTSTATLVPGAYTITFTATAGTLTHTATAILTVTAPPPPTVLACSGTDLTPTAPQAGSTAFIYTGDSPQGAVYDSVHNIIFASNRQLGEIDVISPNSQTIVARIPVTQPRGLDLTADYSTLIVGTDAAFFYRIDTSSLCVIDRPYLTGTGINADLTPSYPISLSDGSIVFQLQSIGSGDSGIVRWTAAGGAVGFNGNLFYSNFIGTIVRSGDHQHLFFSYGLPGSPALMARYDVASGQTTSGPPLAVNESAVMMAANFDGSHIYYRDFNGNGGGSNITLADASFKPIASYKLPQGENGFVFSPQAGRFYVSEGYFAAITVLDASTLAPLGYIPPQTTVTSVLPTLNLGGGTYDAIDGVGRILSPTSNGITLVDFSGLPQPMATPVAIGTGAISEDNVLYGTSFYLQYGVDGGDPAATAAVKPTSVSFSETTTFVSAPFSAGLSVINTPQINITAPGFAGGCADITAGFNVGLAIFVPRAYCYGPVVDVIDDDSGPSSGGATMTLYGKGFGNNPVILIGGGSAHMVNSPFNFPTLALDPETITVTVPPGAPGSAEITVSNGSGPAITLPWPYTYYTRQDAALPAGATPSQIIYDAARSRLLWTDSARNLLVVASPATAATLQEIPIGPQPEGLALSPDGSKLVIATTGDKTVSVYDADTFAKLQSSVMPPTTQGTLTPQQVGVMSNGKVLIAATTANALSGGYDFPYIDIYDLASNTITNIGNPFNGITCDNFADIAVSSDGRVARAGNALYTVSSGNLVTLAGYSQCTQIGISADGAVNTDSRWISDISGRLQNFYSPPALIASKPDGLFNYNDSSYAASLTLNASGSLAVTELATSYFGIHPTDHIRIYDTQHASLVRTVVVPGGLSLPAFSKPLVLDPNGQQMWLFTAAGLTLIQFPFDPLAIGEVQNSAGTLTLLGSGFTPAMTVSVDGRQLSSVLVTGTTTATAPLPTLAPGMHNVTIANPAQAPYVLPVAFTTP